MVNPTKISDEQMYGDAPACPYCEHIYQDAWELEFNDDELELECGECGKTYSCSLYISYSYTSSKIQNDQEEE